MYASFLSEFILSPSTVRPVDELRSSRSGPNGFSKDALPQAGFRLAQLASGAFYCAVLFDDFLRVHQEESAQKVSSMQRRSESQETTFIMTAWKGLCQIGFDSLDWGLLQVKDDLGFPFPFFLPDLQLMIGSTLYCCLDGMTIFVIRFPSHQSLKRFFIQEYKFKFPEEKASCVEEINEFIEPADEKFFRSVPSDGDFTSFLWEDGFRIGDHMKESFCGMMEKIGKAFAEDPDAQIACMIHEFKFTHAELFVYS
jgi:hypothetical protein